MITPTSGSIVVTTKSKTFDGIWILNTTINAQSPLQPVRATMMVCPYNSTTGELNREMTKIIRIADVMATATSSSFVAGAMSNIFGYVQEQVISQSLF
jgi:hypothetical protein